MAKMRDLTARAGRGEKFASYRRNCEGTIFSGLEFNAERVR